MQLPEHGQVKESKLEQAIIDELQICKLPRWFKIPTPEGNYNPDWAVVLEDDEKVYLIRETKSTHDKDKRRLEENLKILCGKAHFKALEGVDYRVATSAAEVTQLSIAD